MKGPIDTMRAKIRILDDQQIARLIVMIATDRAMGIIGDRQVELAAAVIQEVLIERSIAKLEVLAGANVH